MTPTPFTADSRSTDGHPDVEEVSDLVEGLAAPARAAELRAHLAECELCTEVRGSLEEIRDALGQLPGPVRMPGDIAGRIDAALAAEALLSAGSSSVSRETSAQETGAHGADEDSEPATPLSGAPDAPRTVVSRETRHARGATSGSLPDGPAADAAPGRPPGRPTATTGPGRPSAAGRRARRLRVSLLAAAGAVAVLGLGGLALNGLGGTSSGTAPSGLSTAADAALKHRIQRLVAERSSAPHGPTGAGADAARGTGTENTGEGPSLAPSGGPDHPMAGSPTAVPSCIRGGIHRGGAPLAADAHGSYRGGSAYVVVFPHRGDRRRVDAYLVDPTCIGSARPSPARILLERTYPRG